jgi:SAM-dependent methyltransferase
MGNLMSSFSKVTQDGGSCRFCGTTLTLPVTDLGMSPPCESYLTAEQLHGMEAFYPLDVWVCDQCWLVQLPDHITPEDTFVEYAYFSSFSDAWLEHCRDDATNQIARWGLGPDSLVVEVGSNDGYYLRWFAEKGVPVLGVEPARNVAATAVEAGVPTIAEFFGSSIAEQLAAEGRQADLIAGKNVLAQVPDLNDVVAGLRILLAPGGVVTIEFPHLQRLIEGNQFDTIYHEHFSYFSLLSAETVFAHHGLRIFDVEEVWSHGGSLRIYACHDDDTTKPTGERVTELHEREIGLGYASPEAYRSFDEQVRRTKRRLLETLIRLKDEGLSIAVYGAAGKGMTLLNYCGIGTDFVDFAADRSTYKHGRFCPGVHIPILPPEAIDEYRPDIVLILPWNLEEEITAQLAHIREWGGRFLIPVPEARVY